MKKYKATMFHASKSAVDRSTHGIIVKKINIVTRAYYKGLIELTNIGLQNTLQFNRTGHIH